VNSSKWEWRACGSFGMCAIPPKCANYASGVESLHWDLLHAYVTLVEVALPFAKLA
jgi:hypothetical protein